MKKIALALLLALTGCGSMEQQLKLEAIQQKNESVKTYLATNQQALDSGTIKSSTFYSGLANELYRPPISLTDSAYLAYYRDLAEISQQLEENRISKNDFLSQRLNIDAELKNSISRINLQHEVVAESRRRAAIAIYYEGASRMQTCGIYSTNLTCRP